MLRADSVVYFYSLLSIMRCVTPEADGKRCLNEGKTRKEKQEKIAVIRLGSDELTKHWQGLEGFRGDRGFVCGTVMKSIETINHVRVLHTIPKRFYQVFEMVGKITRLQTWDKLVL